MIVRPAYLYIQVGLCLRLLVNIKPTGTPDLAKTTIDLFAKNLKTCGFDVALQAMGAVSYGTMTKDLAAIAADKPIGAAVAALIVAEFKKLEHIIFAEAGTKTVYTLATRRFNTEYLLNSPARLLKDGAFNKLEAIARGDIESSCRCIVFGESTAAAFHILRATESVLRSYYHHHRRQKRLAKPMWGPMLEQLREKKRDKPPAALLISLDLIRTAYRNPTQHPDATYEIDGAQDLLAVCLDSIGKMCDEL